MQVGICGYPGSGKSTVFSALSEGARQAEKGGVSYGNIKVPDARVQRLADFFKPKKTTFAEVTFLDMGGGGRAGTGAFSPAVIQHMRNADVLVHVARGFDNPMVAQPADAARDDGLFGEELVLLDLQILDRRQQRLVREQKKGLEVTVNQRCVDQLEEGLPLRGLQLNEQELATLGGIQLLSMRPLITLYNLSEASWEAGDFPELRTPQRRGPSEMAMAICGSIEAEVASLDPEDQADFLEDLGLKEPARYAFLHAVYELLDLISFLTSGEDECRAWPIRRNTVARKAAASIHSDLERGFIRAEIYQVDELLEAGSEAALKKLGKFRLEGKEYVVQDGDVINFRANV